MPKMLRPQNLRGVDLLRNRCHYCASVTEAQAAGALASGINGNTAASSRQDQFVRLARQLGIGTIFRIGRH